MNANKGRPLFDSYKQVRPSYFIEKHCVFDKATYIQWQIYRLELRRNRASNKVAECDGEIYRLQGELSRLEAE